jgi:hypothetical protein
MRTNCRGSLICSLLLAAAITLGATPVTRIVCGLCEQPDRFVRLQAIATVSDTVDSEQLTNPLILSPEDWTSILRELHVQRQGEGMVFLVPPGPVMQAFTAEEVSYLSVTLSKAFAQAQPNEWIVFGLSGSSTQGLTEITTGGAYVKGSSLHFLLANYRKVVTMPSTRQLLWERPLRQDAGPLYDLVAGKYQTIVRDPNAVSGFFSSAPSELSIAYQALLLGDAVKASDSQESSPMNPSPIPNPQLSIEEQLQVLKRLKEQGLITEEDYRTKKQQLLDRF